MSEPDDTVPDALTAPPSPAAPAAPAASVAPSGDTGSQMGRNAALLFAGTLASRLLGMARETLIAAMFDVAATDAFFVAWRVPNALRAMLAEGAARYVLNPVLSDALHGKVRGGAADPVRMRRALASAKGAALVALSVVTVLGVVFARPLFGLMSGGFRGDAARFELGVGVLRLIFPYIFFMGWFAVGNAALQTMQDAKPGAFAPVMLNVAFLLVPFALAPVLAYAGVHPIYALAGAVLVGGLLQVLYIRPALGRRDLLPRPVVRWDATTREMAALFLPQLFGQAVYQLNIVLAGRFLSSLPTGAASFFNYAQRVADIPQGLFSVALSGAAAMALQQHASQGDHGASARVYERSLRMAAFIALPMTVILAVYAEAVVPLIFGYGRFRRLGDGGVYEVVRSLRWQAIGIAFLAFVHQTTAVFGAYKKRSQIVRAALASVVAFGVVGAFAAPRMGHAGVAAAMAASSAVQLVILLGMVRGLVPVNFRAVGPTLAKVIFATGATALAARAVVTYLPVTGHSIGSKLLAVGCGGALLALYAVLVWVLKCDEMTAVVARFRRKRR